MASSAAPAAAAAAGGGCQTCSRALTTACYCASCVRRRVSEHARQRAQLAMTLDVLRQHAQSHLSLFGTATATTTTATTTGPGATTTAAAGAEHSERALKATKWALAFSVKELRVAAEQHRRDLALLHERAHDRRERLSVRRANLSRAQDYLCQLAARPSTRPIDEADGDDELSLAYGADGAHNGGAWPARSLTELARTRRAYMQDLALVHGRLTDSRRVLRSALAGDAFDLRAVPRPPERRRIADVYIHGVLVPTISALASAPPHAQRRSTRLDDGHSSSTQPTTTTASGERRSTATAGTFAALSHVLQLVRLLALYAGDGATLAFTPLPSLFGPGKPGLRAAPNISLPADVLASSSSSSRGNGAAFPLFAPRASPSASASSSRGEGTDQGRPATTTTTTGAEPRRVSSSGRGARDGFARTLRDEERTKALVCAAVALAYDLLQLAALRGVDVLEYALQNAGEGGQGDDEAMYLLLDDLGACVTLATGESTPSTSTTTTTADVPVDLARAFAHFTGLLPLSNKLARVEALDELEGDAPDGEGELDDRLDDDEDDEWHLV